MGARIQWHRSSGERRGSGLLWGKTRQMQLPLQCPQWVAAKVRCRPPVLIKAGKPPTHPLPSDFPPLQYRQTHPSLRSGRFPSSFTSVCKSVIKIMLESDLRTPLLRESRPVLEESKTEPSAPPQPATRTQTSASPAATVAVPTQSGVRVINCARCRILLQYQVGCYCVLCPCCRTQTATQPLIQFICPKCRQLLMCPSQATVASCPCGQVSALLGNRASA